MPPDPASLFDSEEFIVAVLDTETTGMSKQDEIIEIAVKSMAVDPETGRVIRWVDEYVGLQEPTVPVSAGAASVHGLTTDILMGTSFDIGRLNAIIWPAKFIIAHNAPFDRGFVERQLPSLRHTMWRCSIRDINWKAAWEGSKSLQTLLEAHGISAKAAHRAMDDVRCLVELLCKPAPDGDPYMKQIVHKGRAKLEKQTT